MADDVTAAPGRATFRNQIAAGLKPLGDRSMSFVTRIAGSPKVGLPGELVRKNFEIAEFSRKSR